MTLKDEQLLESMYVMPTFGRSKVEFVSGKGMILADDQGNEYIDFLSGIGVCSLGHCHPSVVQAVQDQAAKLIHVSNYFYIENRGELSEKISDLLDCNQTWKTFYANSGAEANECAIKLARLYAKERAVAAQRDPEDAPSVVVTLVKSFHGRTLATLAATGQQKFHKGFEPIPEGFLPTPINDIESLRNLFNTMGSSICAVMIECVQGESGVHVCSQEFVEEIRSLCDEFGALMICDEVQCGIFRTGAAFGFQNFDVVPDIVTMAKGIASGLPVGACAARAQIADLMTPGKHGSTFGGSNIAVSAALATLSQLERPEYAENILATGQYLRDRLAEIPQVTESRGLGLMCAAELIDGIDAHDVVTYALERGLVINATGPHTLRFLPPLICSKGDVDDCISILTATLEVLS